MRKRTAMTDVDEDDNQDEGLLNEERPMTKAIELLSCTGRNLVIRTRTESLRWSVY